MSALVVRRAQALRGSPDLVGDKSISHRALVLAALADGPTEIRNLSTSTDVARTVACLVDLGVDVQASSATRVTVHGRGLRGLEGDPIELDCGDSGTTMRILAGLLAGQGRPFVLQGGPSLSRRPMARVTDALRALGAEVRPAPGGLPPIIGSGGGRLRGADVALGQASAQVGSSVLLAALRAEGTTVVRYPAPVRDHTERLLAQMGASIDWDGHATTLDGPVEHLSSLGTMRMPADISAAAFLLAACRVVSGSSVRLTGVGVNPGRAGIVDLMVAMGAGVVVGDAGEECGEPTASITVDSGPLQAVQFGMPLIPRLIDELPLVAVLATQARGRTEVRDAGELRVKESDRLVAMVDGLSRLGARIESRPDGFVVEGPSPLVGAEVEGHGDHRVVMAMAVAGLVAEGETVIHDAERVADSFPGFVAALTTIGAPVEVR